jgi:hypothetical protein
LNISSGGRPRLPVANWIDSVDDRLDALVNLVLLSRLLLFDFNAKFKAILGEKEDTIKENDHVTSRNA